MILTRPMDDAPKSTALKTGLISKVLTPAIRLWLKGQTDHLENLNLNIQAGDRAVLSGCIPQVDLTAEAAIYQGIHLSALSLRATDIRTNLPQVLRGKAFQLLSPFPLDLDLQLTEADLNASLNAPLIQPAIAEFLQTFLQSTASPDPNAPGSPDAPLHIQNLACRLQDQTIVLWGELSNPQAPEAEPTAIALKAELRLATPHCIQLQHPTWLPHPTAKRGLPIAELEGYQFDLGPDTDFTQMAITPDAITAIGRLTVLP